MDPSVTSAPRDKPVRAVLATRIGMAALGVFWVLMGITSLPEFAHSTSQSQTVVWIIAILMFGNAAVLIVLGALLAPQRRLVFACALLVLGVNAVLSVTDEFGALDAVSLAVSLALFILLIATRSAYLSRNQPQAG